MRAKNSLIALGILLAVLGVGATALADESPPFESATSDSNLEAPKLTVKIEGTTVTLSWNKVTDAIDYEVHYAQYPYDNPDTVKTIDVGNMTSASYDLSPGCACHVAVKACKDSGSDCSDYSNIHDIKIPLVSTFKNSLGQEFKLIPAGTFIMGSPPNEKGRINDETQHQVSLTQPFYIQTTEVTQNQWSKVMKNNPSHFFCPTCPVEMVSWDDAQAYVDEMNRMGEGTYSLPTEAQWEYAARAGSTTAFYNGGIKVFSGYDPNLDAIGWYGYNSDNKTHPVGQKSPNAWGLYDMSGNVLEWCRDWYGDYPSSAVTNPTGPLSGPFRVRRGGSWLYFSAYCRSAFRNGHNREDGSNHGFRLVREP